ncbi:histidine phosphatase family protein [Pseudalkalibacillus berkeleyi]|uniref:Histidine phosphatase family protein n=1 Tax=Pseudalkalibacillus berkeleyi TaxID=1069813 RepID=A0ABS9GYF2_9BACL|nr:histidine phosphatase family protein [Pseudalkalibacillus berkeleyi]MCF6137792.1 histidine phosphatase family protein [Pseudalkalibacillus berkeleyi]
MIYVVRHGQTDLNKEGRLQGRLGLPLNEEGVKQAERLREDFVEVEFDFVFSSPQERAIQTGKIATGNEPIIDKRLDVFDLGEADRLLKHEVKLAGAVPDPNVYQGVEDIHTYIERVFDFMNEIELKYGGKDVNILISGHKCTTGSIGAYFEGIPEDRNILRLSSDNGAYKTYPLNRKTSTNPIS